jgi:hypothetical protein
VKTLALLTLFAVTACASAPRCPGEDLGGWLTGQDDAYGIQHSCTGGSERFLLQAIASRQPNGSVAEWTDPVALDVPLARGERTMYGFECGSGPDTRGDAVAVVRDRRDGSFEVKRAWKIDAVNRAFVPVPPETVVCESIE